MQALLVKAAIVFVGAILCWSIVRLLKSERFFGSEPAFITFVVVLAIALRVAFYVAIYVLAHKEVTSDVPAYYVPAGRAVLAGLIPYRDFNTSYAPLFSYIGAALLRGYDSPKAFVLFDIVLDVVGAVLWYLAARELGSPRLARTAAVMYACSGAVLAQCMLGTNQHWIAFANAASMYLLARQRSTWSGLIQGISLSAVKILSVLSWPVMWLATRERMKWTAAAVATPVLAYGLLVALGADVLYPLKFEGQLASAGNLPYLFQPWLERAGVLPRHVDVWTLCILFIAVAWLAFVRTKIKEERVLTFAFAALSLLQVLFMLTSKKSFPAYFVFAAFPVGLLIAERTGEPWRLAFFGIINFLLTLESSLWFYLGGEGITLSKWSGDAPGYRVMAFVLTDIALMACYFYVLFLSVKWLQALMETEPNMSDAKAPDASFRPLSRSGINDAA